MILTSCEVQVIRKIFLPMTVVANHMKMIGHFRQESVELENMSPNVVSAFRCQGVIRQNLDLLWVV